MWEEGINTKPQIYYNNNNAGTPQASKRKKKRQFRYELFIYLVRYQIFHLLKIIIRDHLCPAIRNLVILVVNINQACNKHIALQICSNT